MRCCREGILWHRLSLSWFTHSKFHSSKFETEISQLCGSTRSVWPCLAQACDRDAYKMGAGAHRESIASALCCAPRSNNEHQFSATSLFLFSSVASSTSHCSTRCLLARSLPQLHQASRPRERAPESRARRPSPLGRSADIRTLRKRLTRNLAQRKPRLLPAKTKMRKMSRIWKRRRRW